MYGVIHEIKIKTSKRVTYLYGTKEIGKMIMTCRSNKSPKQIIFP